jgi:hypothetical protein
MRPATPKLLLQRSLLALALSAAVFGVAVAGDAPAAQTRTILKLKNGDGATETLQFDGALAVGESRGYETDAGTPVLVTRNDTGLSIETPSRTIEVALPEAEGHHPAGAEVRKIVRINRDSGDSEPGEETRVVVLHGDGSTIDEAHIDTLLEGDLETLAGAEGEGDGERKVIIIRKKQEAPASQ